ncbi:hypothetical protein FB45DRAFT_939262, partial [Roridomyces roridus]
LAVLARTSTVFSDHALRLLWASVALINLLRCIPPDAYNVRVEGKGRTTRYIMTPRRSLQDSDFQRLRFYAAYVRRLFCHADQVDTSRMFPSVHPWLSESMFPMLRVVRWSSSHLPHRKDDIRFIGCFLTPGLTSIDIAGNLPAAVPLAIVSSLATRCPQLTDLSCFSHVDPAAVSALSECIRGLDHIQTLCTAVLNRAALDHLSHLSSLRKLDLHSIPADFPSSGSHSFFPSLVEFDITNVDSACRFLERGCEIPLTWLAVECSLAEPGASNLSTAAQMHRLFSAMESGILHSSVTNILFTDGYGSFHRSDAPGFTIRASSLRRLFCFNNLTYVAMITAVGFDLDNATIVDMARSWPHIESLTLETRFGVSQPRTTLGCLEAFAQYLPPYRQSVDCVRRHGCSEIRRRLLLETFADAERRCVTYFERGSRCAIYRPDVSAAEIYFDADQCE